MSKSSPPMPDELDASKPIEETFTVHAYKENGSRDERAEQIGMPRGFIPGEKERAESVAKRCNQLNLMGVKFVAVSASPKEVES